LAAKSSEAEARKICLGVEIGVCACEIIAQAASFAKPGAQSSAEVASRASNGPGSDDQRPEDGGWRSRSGARRRGNSQTTAGDAV